MGEVKQRSARSVGLNLFAINAFVYIALSVYQPYLSAFLSSEGLNASQIGVLLAIGPVAALLIQPVWARISDRTGKRRTVFALVALGSSLTMLTGYIDNSFMAYFISIFLFSSFTNAIIPLSDAIIVQQAHKYGLDYAMLRLGGTLGWSVTVYLGGLLLKVKPHYLFLLGSLGYLAMFFLGLWLPKNVDEAKKVVKDKAVPAEKGIFKNKDYIFILALAFVTQVGLNFNTGFLGMYVVEIGYAQNTIGLLNCVSALSEIPVLIFISKLTKKLGAVRILIFSCFMLSVRIILVTIGKLPAFLLAQSMQSITYMTVHFCCVVWLYDNVKEGKLSQGQSILAMLQVGLGSIVGSAIGGVVVDGMGLKMAYTTIAACVFGLTALISVSYYFYKKYENKKAAAA